MDLQNVTEYMIEVAHGAGELVMEYYQKPELKFSNKSNQNDFVTEADLASEKYILEKLQERFPLFNVFAEETGAQETDSEYTWIIDPIDGTANFLHGLDYFAINIALQHNDEIVAGVTYSPIFNKTYHAYKGAGAFLNNQKIQVSKAATVRQSILCTGFPYERKGHMYEQTKKFIINAADSCKSIRRFGSAALDMAHVASGKLDGFFEYSLQAYDIAAGIILIQEAGGQLTNTDGSPLDIHGQNIIASNGLIHQELIHVLNS